MGYIKKAYRKILEEIDSTNYLPPKWSNFISRQKEYHNILIKKENKCVCTNCKHIFKTNKKVNQTEKCPHCKNTYIIKRSNLKRYSFVDNISFLDRVDGKFVIRVFELFSYYCNISKKFNSSIVEFARIMPDEYDATFVNDRVSRCQCYIHVNHMPNAREMEIIYKTL